MYAAIRMARCVSGKQDEVANKVRDEYVPMMQKLAGLHGYYLVKGANDTLFTVSIFDTAEHAHGSNTLAKEWVPNALAGLLDGPLQPHEGEIIYQL